MRAAFKSRAAITRRGAMPEEVLAWEEEALAAASGYHQTAFDQLCQFNDAPFDDFGFIEDFSESFDGPRNSLSPGL